MKRTIKVSRDWLKQHAKIKHDVTMLAEVNRLESGDTTLCKTTLDCFFKKYEMLTKYRGTIFKKESEDAIKIAESKYENYKNYDWRRPGIGNRKIQS